MKSEKAADPPDQKNHLRENKTIKSTLGLNKIYQKKIDLMEPIRLHNRSQSPGFIPSKQTSRQGHYIASNTVYNTGNHHKLKTEDLRESYSECLASPPNRTRNLIHHPENANETNTSFSKDQKTSKPSSIRTTRIEEEKVTSEPNRMAPIDHFAT